MKLNPAAQEKIKTYLRELEEWSGRFNLCSFDKKDYSREVAGNSLIFADIIKNRLAGNSKICDIGSGAGIPGIILKIALPEAEVDLLESNGKKASFLEHVRRKLGLKGLNIVNRDAREIASEGKKLYNAAAGRAFGKGFLKYAEKLTADGGIILYFKKGEAGNKFGKGPDEVIKFPGASVLLWNR